MKVSDVHYWVVWWGGAQVEAYKDRVGYFNSEYGMQSLLPMSSLKLFLSDEDMEDQESPTMIYHNKMNGGTKIVERYTM